MKTANKQLNFVQHVMAILKPGGRAAIVVPDNVLFEETAGKEVRKLLMEDCNLHTILRLPEGTFTPYSTGVKANIVFFSKGQPSKDVWIYDNRTNMKKIAIRRPLTAEYFEDFEQCYHAKPRKQTERFRRFTRDEIAKRDHNLDIFWLKDISAEGEERRDPEELLTEAIGEAETALDDLRDVLVVLGNKKRKGG